MRQGLACRKFIWGSDLREQWETGKGVTKKEGWTTEGQATELVTTVGD